MTLREEIFDLAKSSAIIQGTLAVALTGALIFQVLNGQAPSEALLTLDGTIVGYYFGTKSQQSIERAAQRAAESQAVKHG